MANPDCLMRLLEGAGQSPRRAALAGGLFAALITLPGLGLGTLWDNSETAYGEVAREILLSHDWLVMHLNGEPWFVQPPLYFWIAAFFAKLFGVGAFAMRLPSALATVAMGATVGYGVARVAGTRAGMYSAAILATNLMQAIVGRLAIMDALLDASVTAAVLWWFEAFGSGVLQHDGRSRATFLVCGAAALALGTLAKGPVAPLIVGLVIGGWLLWEWYVRAPLFTVGGRVWIAAACTFSLIALPWFALLVARVGPSAVAELIGHYTFGRFTGVIENQRGPWFYYLPVLILGFFPWIAFLPVAGLRAWRVAQDRTGSLLRLALVWTVLPLAFFSAAQTKLPNYVALIIPALAIIVGLWFDEVRRGRDRFLAIVSAAVVPLTIGCIAFAIIAFGRSNGLAISIVAPQLLALALGMIAGSVGTMYAIARAPWSAAAPYVLGLTSLILVLFIVFVAEPIAERLKPIAPMAALINRERTPSSVVAIRGVSGGNGLVFYTRPGVQTIDPDMAASYARAVCSSDVAFVVTRRADVAALNALTKRLGRSLTELDVNGKTALVRIRGERCLHLASNTE